MLGFQKRKTFLLKDTLKNWSEEVFVVSKIKDIIPRTYVISNLNREKNAEGFYEKELQKTNQNEYRIEK